MVLFETMKSVLMHWIADVQIDRSCSPNKDVGQMLWLSQTKEQLPPQSLRPPGRRTAGLYPQRVTRYTGAPCSGDSIVPLGVHVM